MTAPMPTLPTAMSLVRFALHTALWTGPRFTLTALVSTFDISTSMCRATDVELAQLTGYRVEQVRAHLDVLLALGALERGPTPGSYLPRLPLRRVRRGAADDALGASR